MWPPASRPRLLRIALQALVARFKHGGRHRGARPPHRVQILRQEAPRQRPLQDPLHPRTEKREEYGHPYPEKAKDEEMSGPPYALQRLSAIINFSGGRSSAFMLHHLLEHDDGRLQAKSALGVKPPCGGSLGSYFLIIKREKPPHDNQRAGFPPVTDVLDSERPIDRLPPPEIRHVRPPPLTGQGVSTSVPWISFTGPPEYPIHLRDHPAPRPGCGNRGPCLRPFAPGWVSAIAGHRRSVRRRIADCRPLAVSLHAGPLCAGPAGRSWGRRRVALWCLTARRATVARFVLCG